MQILAAFCVLHLPYTFLVLINTGVDLTKSNAISRMLLYAIQF